MVVQKVAGLTPAEMSMLLRVFEKYPTIEKVVLFGSRSTGKHKQGSDVDLVIYGEKANFGTLFDIEDALYDAGFELELDILLHSIIQDEKLLRSIDRTAAVIYQSLV
ncbi:MAG: nucleotidyltransferase domain-containing protein [Bacteroidetes bacterium]|jgi:predicted nucleotidyltransferase|nr:nucleotidyltransferase domain-containing protein [Bacteroidota bacterium]